MSITEKRCSKCREVKSVSEFSRSKDKKYGLHSHCKSCRKKYYEENKEHFRQRNKKHYEENKEHYKQWRKKYYEENKEYFKQYHKKHYEENKEHYNQCNKKYCEENNRIKIKNKTYNIKTAPEELKPLLTFLIQERNLKNKIKKYEEVTK